MPVYKTVSHLCIRTIQNAIKDGWPNKNFKRHTNDVTRALNKFREAEHRDLTFDDVVHFLGAQGTPRFRRCL